MPLSAAAAPTCQEDIRQSLIGELLMLRSVLYGQEKAHASRIGAVRVDREGNAWLKTSGSSWQSYAPGFENTAWSSALTEARAAAPARRGILETPKALTSELLPQILQGMRAFQCRLRAICAIAQDSRSAAAGASLTVSVPGCLPVTRPSFASCATKDLLGDQATISAVYACDEEAQMLLEREVELVKFAVAYDSAYRTLLQFKGQMENFSGGLRLSLMNPLWQLQRLTGELRRIPCFQAQCNE